MYALRQRAASSVSVLAGKLSDVDGLLQQALDVGEAAVVGRVTAGRRRRRTRRRTRTLWKMTSNTACVRGVGRKAHEAVDRQRAQRSRDGSFCRTSPAHAQHRLHWELLALAQRVEEMCLVAEVPVNGAARDAGGGSDLGKRGMRDATLAEHLSRRVEQLLAGDLGLGFRASRHRYPVTRL
jgi:hypothetical protein